MLSKESWQAVSQRGRKEADRETSKFRGLVEGQITAWNPTTELMSVSTPIGPMSVPYHHAHIGLNSWLRTGPEPGSSVLLSHNADTGRWDSVSTFSRFRRSRSANYEAADSLWRPVRSGELDGKSPAGAGFFARADGTLELSGGQVYGALDNNTLTAWWKAGLHQRKLAYHSTGHLGSEERLGVATRRQVADTEHPVKVTDDTGTYFAHEYYRSIMTSSSRTPIAMTVEGNVLDDVGKPVLADETGRPLRSLRRLRTSTGALWESDIDDVGNSWLRLPDTARLGVRVQVPRGSLQVRCDDRISLEAQGRGLIHTRDGLRAGSDGTTALLGRRVDLGRSATSQVITLDDLNAWISMLRATLVATAQAKPFAAIVVPPAIKARVSVFAGP